MFQLQSTSFWCCFQNVLCHNKIIHMIRICVKEYWSWISSECVISTMTVSDIIISWCSFHNCVQTFHVWRVCCPTPTLSDDVKKRVLVSLYFKHDSFWCSFKNVFLERFHLPTKVSAFVSKSFMYWELGNPQWRCEETGKCVSFHQPWRQFLI